MKKLTFGAIAVVFLVSLGLAGVGAAQTYENVSSSDMPINETVAPDSDTESIQVIAENVTNGTADVTIFELEDGNETQIDTGTLDTSATDTATDVYEYSQINTSLEYRVLVEGDGADMIDVAKVQVVSAGGGGGSGDLVGDVSVGDLSETQLGIVAVVLALVGAGAVAYYRE
ncbi:hypothetical protein HSBGL_0867 [Halapricum desulfuricans]|uniref:PGF-CTERM sorting domain-containing protein n=1 Tax=Halapricum desulfuricans TaxID=2841257 RepID=A0A897NF32_9EURY|nr:hypothetical protein [Halapricum desulfuricans]QSG11297.1 hypothetical protein HSBGL_0867 [Halapricum desulfuricans]